MISITHLLPVLSLLVTPYAMPQGYDYGYAAPSAAAAQAHAPSVAAAHDYAPSAAAYVPSMAAAHEVSAAAPSAHSTIPYDEGKQHSALWNSWTPSAAAHTAAATPSMGVYGSGSEPKDLESCLQVCHAAWAPPSTISHPAALAATSAPVPAHSALPVHSAPPAAGTPVTHTIIVAPTQGVLRFVPFSVQADVGDSLEFIWGAGPHSATLSQGQNVCNKSSTVEAFDSGKLNATAKFVVKVNSTTPSFHYCTVGMHCANGMYGIVNPPTTNVTTNLTATRTTPAAGPGSTAGSGSSGCNGDRMDCWVANWAASAPEASATVKAVQRACEGTDAWKWGAGLEMTAMLGDAVTKKNAIENVMYTRLMLSMNPSMLSPAGDAAAVPATWVAAPDLKSFVQQSEINPSAPGPAVAALPSTSADAPSGGVDAAAANTSTSGAGRIGAPLLLLSFLSGLAILL